MTAHSDAMGAPPLDHCPLMPTYGPPALQLVRGEGSWLWDKDGRRYLDLLSGLAVTGLGHSHPAVAAALHEQAQTLLHVSNLFGTDVGWQVACTLDRLLGVGPESSQPGWPAAGTRGQVFFANSGAEANECALKLARRFGGRGRHVVVSAFGSFHGRTLATLHATGQPAKHEAFQPLPEGFRHVAWNDLAALESALDPSVAAVLLEPVQGEGGVNPATVEYFTEVRRLCDERGALFIVDEVQTGLGRCGAWFGHQRLGVVPDVVTVAKAAGNGVPVGAVVTTRAIADAFAASGSFFSSVGGSAMAAAAGIAVLDAIEAEGLQANAREVGAHLRAGLQGMVERFDLCGAVHGHGLFLGLELVRDPETLEPAGAEAAAICERALELGLVIQPTGDGANVLKIKPPLCFSMDDAVHLIGVLGRILEEGW